MNNTLVKGLQLLEVLARSREPQGVSDLAAQLSLGKSNVHRLLQALVELGASVEVGFRIKAAASEAMTRLLVRTRETVHLSVLDGEEVVYVHKLDSPEPVRAYSEIGGRAPTFCVATGKAMLAWQPAAGDDVPSVTGSGAVIGRFLPGFGGSRRAARTAAAGAVTGGSSSFQPGSSLDRGS